jgi:hypothetical protein
LKKLIKPTMKKTIIIFSFILAGSMSFAQQNLGVNQANPQAKIHITNTENQNSLQVDDEDGDASPFTVNEDGQVGVMNNNPQVSLDINATDAVNMPNGTTAQRPTTPSQGAMRFNSEVKSMEFFDGTNWVSLTPAGSIQMFAGVQAQLPGGWLVCDGSEVSRTDYAALFAVIGTNFGEGDGATTFHLPDLRGRFARGADNGAGNDPDAAARTASNVGGNTGDAVGSLQDDAVELPGVFANINPGANAAYSLLWSNGTTGSETRPKNISVNYLIKY